MKRRLLLLAIISITFFQQSFSQGSPDYNGGMKVKLNDDGSKYFRVISWVQGQAIYNFDAPENHSNVNFQIKRVRVLMYSQITDKFLILTHFGLNNLNSNNMSPTGQGSASHLFLHSAWAQYKVATNHDLGIGLHYFNGISRLNNQSTLNMLTLDNNRQSWSTLGLSDQFGRHLGIFAKGKVGKLQYRVSINDAIVNNLDNRDAMEEVAVYGGKRILGSKEAGFTYAGYFEYNLMDQESNFLPYKVGTYLGAKTVFNIGAGFFYHPNGSVIKNEEKFTGEDVKIFAVDAFFEAPLSDKGNAITTYATYQNNNYGVDYMYSAYGTGDMIYAHLGYLFSGDKSKPRFQLYSSVSLNNYDATKDSKNILGVGANLYLSGHNSKLTLEYKNETFGEGKKNIITLQAMIYL